MYVLTYCVYILNIPIVKYSMYHKSKLETKVNQRKRLFHSHIQTILQLAYHFMFIHMIQYNVTQHIHTYTSKNT